MLNNVHIIEEIIEYLREQLPKDMPILLDSSDFERGKVAQLYLLIDGLERLYNQVDEDLMSNLKDTNNGL